jgi:hypothetical protein
MLTPFSRTEGPFEVKLKGIHATGKTKLNVVQDGHHLKVRVMNDITSLGLLLYVQTTRSIHSKKIHLSLSPNLQWG